MKNSSLLFRFTCFSFLFSFLSCHKSTSSPSNQLLTVGFDANGKSYHWTVPCAAGIITLCGPNIDQSNGHLRFGFSGSLSQELYFFLPGSSLSVNTYTLTLTDTIPSNAATDYLLIKDDSIDARCVRIGDFVTLTVTNTHDVIRADGTFSAQMTLPPYDATAKKIVISNGTFRNAAY